MRRRALTLCLGAALALAGCGKASTTPPAELALEREDLVFVCRALQQLEGQAGAEVRATRTAWPQVLAGLPPRRHGLYSGDIADAVEAAGRLRLPTLFEERPAAALTGPASGIAGLYRTFAELAGRGWQMVGAAIYQAEHGGPSAARFARANVALYIESVYDGHFSLAQIGKKLASGYRSLGGAAAFGSSLTDEELRELTTGYSEAADRLHPHVGVRLGS